MTTVITPNEGMVKYWWWYSNFCLDITVYIKEIFRLCSIKSSKYHRI